MLDIVMGKNSQLPNLMVKEVSRRESEARLVMSKSAGVTLRLSLAIKKFVAVVRVGLIRRIYRPVFQVLLSLTFSQKWVKHISLVSLCPLIKSNLRELVLYVHIHHINRCRMWFFDR